MVGLACWFALASCNGSSGTPLPEPPAPEQQLAKEGVAPHLKSTGNLDSTEMEWIGTLPMNLRIGRESGTIVDEFSPDIGKLGECIRLDTDDGGNASCRVVDDKVWSIWENLIHGGVVGWAGLPEEVAYVVVTVDGEPIASQRPVSGVTTLSVPPVEGTLGAHAIDRNGEVVATLEVGNP